MPFKWLSVIFLTVLLLFGGNDARGQNRRKAERIFADAKQALQSMEDQRAMELLTQCLQTDSTFADAWWLSGDLSADAGFTEAAIFDYKKAVQFNPALNSLLLPMAQLELKTGRYEDAKSDAGHFITSTVNISPVRSFIPNQSQLIRAKTIVQQADTALYFMAHPVNVVLHNMDSSINTQADEYINTITADESTLIFTRKSRPQKNAQAMEELFVAHKDSLGWKVSPLQFENAQRVNTGALSISPDGNTVWYTLCGARDGFGSCDLYVSQRHNQDWSQPTNLGPVINTVAWETQPSISADGTTLYFVSNRPGGVGNADIWVSHKDKNDDWGPPVNLGPPVNTPQDEMSPFIHPDGRTLYFSSKGHAGLGGSDLFVSRMGSDGKWGEPVNLGYPINTYADEISLLVNPAGDKAYISSTQKGGYGGFDIYYFSLPTALRPSPVTYVRGIVTDSENGKPLAASFELINLASNQTELKENSSQDDGSFLLCLIPGKDYGLNVSRPDYLFYSQHFALTEIKEAGNPYLLNIKLQRIKTGNVTVLNNIFFDTDSYELLDRSKSELERLVAFLKSNPSIKIKVMGHTDSQGDEKKNLILSDNRAKAVVNYLISAGIASSRLSFIGYGETQPIDTNKTEEGRARNRRTEFKIE